MFAGGMINIPVRRVLRDEPVPDHPLAVFGLGGVLPDMARARRETVVAVNVGGCLIPTGIALYDVMRRRP